MQLDVGNLAGEHALHYIGAIQAVHAVGAHHALLRAQNLARFLADQLALPEAYLQLGHEVSIAEHLLLHDVDELAQVLPLHFLALAVEVEPRILNVRVLQRLRDLRELVAYALLAALLVNQVDEVLPRVVCLRLLHVFLRSLERLIKVGCDGHGRRPCQVWFHLPEQWD